MFKITNNVIRITRGDTGIFTLYLQSGCLNYDYSNDTVLFTVKANTYTEEILIQKQVVYGENVIINPSDTANLPYADYVYDVQVTTANGVVDTVIPPTKFIVTQEVTFNE